MTHDDNSLAPAPLDPKFEVLMVKVVDDIATVEEREQLMRFLMDHPVLRLEFESHMALKATTDAMVQRLQVDVVEDRHHNAPLAKVEHSLAPALILGGGGLLLGFAVSEILLNAAIPLPIRIGIGSLVAGVTVGFGAVLRWRQKVRKHDRYTEVIR